MYNVKKYTYCSHCTGSTGTVLYDMINPDRRTQFNVKLVGTGPDEAYVEKIANFRIGTYVCG